MRIMKPYQVIPDYHSMHYYLACISRPMNTSQEQDKIASFRISRLQSIRPRPKTYRSGRLTHAEQSRLVKRLESDGVQFLLSPMVEVELLLTERGMERFHNQAHLRPQMDSYEPVAKGYLCRFHCTELQVRYYFFQYGPDVEILKPVSLRDFFREKYRNALSLYEGN